MTAVIGLGVCRGYLTARKTHIMQYYFSRLLKGTLEEVKERTVRALAGEGFGVLTEIDLQDTLKKKLNVDFYGYIILGACNPQFAFQALSHEDKIGTMLPCNVILQEKQPGIVEVSAVDPVASMLSIDNASLQRIAGAVREKFKHVIEKL